MFNTLVSDPCSAGIAHQFPIAIPVDTMMTGTIPGLCGLGRWLSVCGLWCATAVCATVALADDAGKPSGAASPLEDVVTRPGPPARMSVGHFDDNPGCVNAKLDIWLARGRHTH